MFIPLKTRQHHPPLNSIDSPSLPPPFKIHLNGSVNKENLQIYAAMKSLHLPLFFTPRTFPSSSRKLQPLQSNRSQSFLNLKPDTKPESLDIDLPRHDPSARVEYDVAVIGTGPSGLHLAEKISSSGIRVCCIDPSPQSVWPNNYGVWVDEFEAMDLQDCLDHTWPLATVFVDEGRRKYLDRRYGRVSRKVLKEKLMKGCCSNGVKFHEAKGWGVVHEEFKSWVECSDGGKVKAGLVVDASGFYSNFLEYDKPRKCGFQIAHGILAEVEDHPFDLDKMVLMDWRDSHMGNEPYLRASNSKHPTFLYAMPFSSSLIFLEETSLVSRPALSYSEIKRRMVARLRHLGIRVKAVHEEEKCLIPMGGALPIVPQSVVGTGGASGLVHPSTGYMVAKALGAATVLADAIIECMGSTRMIRGRHLHGRVWSSLWPLEKRLEREAYCFGMETLLKLDLKGTRRFFDAFFDLDPHYWHGFLSSRLSLAELAALSVSLFGHASNLSRLDILTKCPLPLAKMVWNLAAETL